MTASGANSITVSEASTVRVATITCEDESKVARVKSESQK
jgi:hypothetical protein